MYSTHDDSGPAFPCQWDDINSNHAAATGMSKRELFAAILMHSEAVTCGVPGAACDALVEASRAAGTDVIDHMAMNAVQGADALLRALAEPRLPEYRELHPGEKRLVEAAEHGRTAMYAIRQDPSFEHIPRHLREQVSKAVAAFEEAEIPF